MELNLSAVATGWVQSILDGVPIRHRVGGSRHDDTWVFLGYRHDGHMLPSSLATKLRATGLSPGPAHQASVAAIVTQVPPAVVARLLGVQVSTAARWHILAGTDAAHR